MFSIEPHLAILFYLCIALLILLLTAFVHTLSKKAKKPLSAQKQLTHCEYCHFIYVGLSGEKISKCPQCQQYNKK